MIALRASKRRYFFTTSTANISVKRLFAAVETAIQICIRRGLQYDRRIGNLLGRALVGCSVLDGISNFAYSWHLDRFSES